TPVAVRAALRDGNRRYREGAGRHPHQAETDREALLGGQRPMAVVLGCSDARVPVSVVLDQGLGDLFVVRVAGHALGDNVRASVHYAVEQLGVPLALVLGHQGCGAVGATLDAVRDGGDLTAPLLRDVAPSAQAAWAGCPGAGTDAARYACAHEDAVRRHADATAARLRTDPVLAPHLAAGDLDVVSAVYELDTGRIDGL
ncbi:MAG: carbonic anhydrase, partial [Trueperaceae bacterium]|nr:carbonic anhydrase [Trueperaceae bacterium]